MPSLGSPRISRHRNSCADKFAANIIGAVLLVKIDQGYFLCSSYHASVNYFNFPVSLASEQENERNSVNGIQSIL